MDHHEIGKIQEQFRAGQWPKFLEMIEIFGLRGWTGQTVNFNFPVVAIVGENGTGKSTLLKTAACAYENQIADRQYFPSVFFVKTLWDKVGGVSLSYRVKEGSAIRSFKITKPTKRWSIPDNRPKRGVFILDISRTLPLDASAGYAKIARLAANEVSTNQINDDFRKRLNFVLGREYSKARFAKSNIDAVRDVGLLTREFGEISQFHQGAGEDATLDLFRTLQEIPDYSLLIIDEVEASLHPRAQRRLTKFLLWLSRQKRLQIILSTHSPYVLEELPTEARLLLLPSNAGLSIVYGITPEFAMSRIDDGEHPELSIFVEDREAEILLREILASSSQGQALIPRIRITAAGAANVVQVLGQLAVQNRLPMKSISALDGDYPESPGCIRLPGAEAPEKLVFAELKARGWPELQNRFGIGAGALFGFLDDAMLDLDHHNWTTRVGDKILKSKISVWEVLANQWCKDCLQPADRDRIVQSLTDKLEVA